MYKNFAIGDFVVSTYPYAYIPLGTKVQIAGITSTGSLKLYGVPGTYLAKNFRKDEYATIEKTCKSTEQDLYIAFSMELYDNTAVFDTNDIINELKKDNEIHSYSTKVGSYEEVRKFVEGAISADEPAYFIVKVTDLLTHQPRVKHTKLG